MKMSKIGISRLYQDYIDEMKCPYCGDTAEQDYGDMVSVDYNVGSFDVTWRITCPICKKQYGYKEEWFNRTGAKVVELTEWEKETDTVSTWGIW